jgi:ABC-type multidrug transport system ATPase subunit
LAGDRIVILSTHIVSDAEATATEIAIINQGTLLEHTEPERLLQTVEGKVWQWIIPSVELTAVRQHHLISSTTRRSDGVHIRVVADTAPSNTSTLVMPTLEDAYLYCISSTNRSSSREKETMQ